ncbi:MAG: hypothetical protein QOD13_3725 [Thermoleophilaceae bacterium]|jgi:hypothetical protein|nr:hypothetical protein [Thermoleophilaceae bacterium]
MDLRRLRAGEWVAAASGVTLLVSLFLPWYGPDISAWESFTVIDVLLAFIAAAGVLLAVVTATHSIPAVPLALSTLVVIAGLVGVLLVLFRVADLPDAANGREWALWLGLAGAAGVPVGAWVAMSDERVPAGPPSVDEIPIAAPRP